METAKVFGIGFHKTGTSSLHQALKILGYRAIHGDPRFGPPYGDEGRSLIQQLQQGDYQLPTLEQYGAFTDNPYFSIWKELDRHYPGSKFILTIRDEADWLRSCVDYYRDKRIRPMRQWMFGENADPSSGEKAQQAWLEAYRRHNADITDHFKHRPDDLLVMNIIKGEGWEKLCPFLKLPQPGQSFPAANITSAGLIENKRKHRRIKRISGGVKRLLYRWIDHLIGRKTFYFISHPKSGRTWLAMALSKIMEEQYVISHFALIYPYAYLRWFEPDIPRIIFWHLASNRLTMGTRLLRPTVKNIFLLVRDPRDVVVSYFHQMTLRKVKFEGTMSEFIRSGERGLPKIVQYMNQLAGQKERFHFFKLIRYEDMQQDMSGILDMICRDTGILVSAELIQQAVDWAQFDNMQAREAQGYYTPEVLQLNPRDKEDINTFKARKGKIGSHKEELSVEDIAYVNEYITAHLHEDYAFYK